MKNESFIEFLMCLQNKLLTIKNDVQCGGTAAAADA